MDADEAEAFAGGVGGPGPEDWANAAAALAVALLRQGRMLAQTAAALRAAVAVTPGDPMAGPLSDVRRQRAVLHAAGEAAQRAALALEASEAILLRDPDARVVRIAEAARRAGIAPSAASPLLRAAALDFRSDGAAARIAATAIAQDVAARLDRV